MLLVTPIVARARVRIQTCGAVARFQWWEPTPRDGDGGGREDDGVLGAHQKNTKSSARHCVARGAIPSNSPAAPFSDTSEASAEASEAAEASPIRASAREVSPRDVQGVDAQRRDEPAQGPDERGSERRARLAHPRAAGETRAGA